jgi:hypothetical protein
MRSLVAPAALIKDGVVRVGPNMMTGYPGIFVGSDRCRPSGPSRSRSGTAKKAARDIDAWLRGGAYEPAPRHEIATFEQLKNGAANA